MQKYELANLELKTAYFGRILSSSYVVGIFINNSFKLRGSEYISATKVGS